MDEEPISRGYYETASGKRITFTYCICIHSENILWSFFINFSEVTGFGARVNCIYCVCLSFSLVFFLLEVWLFIQFFIYYSVWLLFSLMFFFISSFIISHPVFIHCCVCNSSTLVLVVFPPKHTDPPSYSSYLYGACNKF